MKGAAGSPRWEIAVSGAVVLAVAVLVGLAGLLAWLDIGGAPIGLGIVAVLASAIGVVSGLVGLARRRRPPWERLVAVAALLPAAFFLLVAPNL